MKWKDASGALDRALGFFVLLPLVIVPAYFFARSEVSREVSRFDRWRAVAIGLLDLGHEVPDEHKEALDFRFTVKAGEVDEFGIAKGTVVQAFDAFGRTIKVPPDEEGKLVELAGLARAPSQKDPTCSLLDEEHIVCAKTTNESTVKGAKVRATPVRLDFFLPFVVLLLGSAFVFLYSFFIGVRERAVATAMGAICAVASVLAIRSCANRTLDFLVASESLLPSVPAPQHHLETGVGFVLFVTLVTACLVFFLASPAKSFMENIRQRPSVYAAIAPALIGMLVLVFIPFFMGVYLAFLDNEGNFIGLQNFAEILFPSGTSDTNFYFTLGVTIMWTVLNVSLHVVIGLFLALVLQSERLRGRSIYRVLLIVPWAVPNYITALIWKWIFNTQYGPANAFLALFGAGPVDWLGRSFWTNFLANLVTNTWLGFPFMMVVSLGALQSIPQELYEAAKIDGASRWAQFRHVTLPLLKPALFPAIILGTIWTFNMFNVVYLVSGGAPDNKTNILITEAYRLFRVLKNYGMAAAYSLTIFAILLVYTALTNRYTKAQESVYE
jgi:ABC-type sugar transport system permease subunit